MSNTSTPVRDSSAAEILDQVYVPKTLCPDWPELTMTIRIGLAYGMHEFGWDGRNMWIELPRAKTMDPAIACYLILLRLVGKAGGILKKDSYWAVYDPSKPHLDKDRGGLFQSTFGSMNYPRVYGQLSTRRSNKERYGLLCTAAGEPAAGIE